MKNINVKRYLVFILSITVAMSAFAGCSESTQTPQSSENNSSQTGEAQSQGLKVSSDDDFSLYLADDEKSYVASVYEGEGAAVYNIPGEYKGLEVTEIAGDCYKLSDNLIEVNIPDSITKIGYGSFAFCENLETVNMGNGVEIIEDSAFIGCSKLQNLTLSENLKEIQTGAFISCTSLKKVIIPDGVKIIEESAFGGCTSLEEIHISASVTEIEGVNQSGAFTDCSKLTIYAPAGSYAEQYAKDNGIPFVAE